MATTALSTMRQRITELDGSYVSGSTTTNIAASASTILDTKLPAIGYHQDDALNGWWIWLNTTNNASVERTISDYAGSSGTTGTLTIRGSVLSAETASVSFSLYKFRPQHIRDAINAALVAEYPWIFQQVENTTLHTHVSQSAFDLPSGIQNIDAIYEERQLGFEFDENLLHLEGYSAGFETWTVSTRPKGSDAPTDLTLTKYGANQEEEDFVLYGEFCCKAVAGTTAGSHYWTAVANPGRYAGQLMTYEEKIYSKTASRIKVEIKDNAGTTASTSFHGGTGWEMVRATHTVASGATSLTAGVTVAAGAAFTFFRDEALLTRAERYVEKRWRPLRNWSIYNDIIRFHVLPTPKRFLRLTGRAPLSSVTSDTDTVEIGEPQTQILYRAALLYLYNQYRSRDAGKVGNPWNDESILAGLTLAQARRLYGMKVPGRSLPAAQP